MNKKFIIVEFLFYALFLTMGLIYVLHDRSEIGSIPSVDERKLLLTIKDDVFKKAFKSANNWIKVIDNKKSLQLCAIDTVKFKNMILGEDSLAIQTMEEFPEHGFNWEYHEDYGWSFYIPREKISEKDQYNYVCIPTWLIVTLVDEGVLEMTVDIGGDKSPKVRKRKINRS